MGHTIDKPPRCHIRMGSNEIGSGSPSMGQQTTMTSQREENVAIITQQPVILDSYCFVTALELQLTTVDMQYLTETRTSTEVGDRDDSTWRESEHGIQLLRWALRVQ